MSNVAQDSGTPTLLLYLVSYDSPPEKSEALWLNVPEQCGPM
jgi:hypothetical protein